MQFDLTRPNSGRVLDHWLGGTHNFEVDRQFADQVSQTFPAIVQSVKEARRFVRYVVQHCHSRGIRALIDFGSSLPTCDNTHLIVQELDPRMKVVYSDIDPITAAYGHELVEGQPNVIYLQGDAAEPLSILDAPKTCELLGDERRVGFIFLNLAHALPTDPVKKAWQTLYDWAAPDSYLAVTSASLNWRTEPDLAAVLAMYSRAKIDTYFRSPAELEQLLAPWQITEDGIQPNTDWEILRDVKPPRVLAYGMLARK